MILDENQPLRSKELMRCTMKPNPWFEGDKADGSLLQSRSDWRDRRTER